MSDSIENPVKLNESLICVRYVNESKLKRIGFYKMQSAGPLAPWVKSRIYISNNHVKNRKDMGA